ncbi:MFS transporter [Pseudoduganella plicata]|uniref:MFS transporter n=1 Tax=Pseudoduganella plicata TaxID=321984 RepID=A0A4P7BFY7_9BURK|nr:MFS transporter [Pseudoduganella plicata]QBQ37614.1 MFS transporter [Pseudoduganella plicata]GGY91707.1 MFS transporter [Pseudoduganella plicata]
MKSAVKRNPWAWVPTLYFGQGIPYFTAMTLALVMYKNTGFSNTEIAFYTSWLYLPWVIKPLWAPVVDMFGTKRRWVVALQAAIAVALALVAFTTHLPAFFQVSLAVLWLMAFSSATHDIAADGFYMLGLSQKQQAAFVGVRSTFYRLANITGQGVLVALSGILIRETGDARVAWAVIFALLGAVFAILAVYHFFMLPHPVQDHAVRTAGTGTGEFFTAFVSFFRKDGILTILGFLLLFRLGESQLLKMVVPFLLDPVDQGGLGLDNTQVGVVYGTVGVIALTVGGLLGGFLIARYGLKRCLWPMALIIHLPDLVFVYLSMAQPQNIVVIGAAMAVEQFGYGLGFTSYMMFMIMVADGEHKTAHYAMCTGLMALGMMVPQMASGYLQQMLGYQHFFIWVCLATIPAFIMTALVKVDPAFGRE